MVFNVKFLKVQKPSKYQNGEDIYSENLFELDRGIKNSKMVRFTDETRPILVGLTRDVALEKKLGKSHKKDYFRNPERPNS